MLYIPGTHDSSSVGVAKNIVPVTSTVVTDTSQLTCTATKCMCYIIVDSAHELTI